MMIILSIIGLLMVLYSVFLSVRLDNKINMLLIRKEVVPETLLALMENKEASLKKLDQILEQRVHYRL